MPRQQPNRIGASTPSNASMHLSLSLGARFRLLSEQSSTVAQRCAARLLDAESPVTMDPQEENRRFRAMKLSNQAELADLSLYAFNELFKDADIQSTGGHRFRMKLCPDGKPVYAF